SVVLNWNAATDNIGVTGYDIYRNGSYLSTSASTSSTITGLSSSTTYSFYVKAKDAAGNASGASNTVSITTDEIVATYCESKGNDFSYEWIAEVQIGTYSNSSNGAAYTDFTSENITLEAGSAVSVSLTPGFASSSYNEYWKIWIDYNDDGDFDDANELAFTSAASKSAVSGTMNIPSTASGIHRMRVTMKYNAVPTSCETFSYGEVEDYTVNISAGGFQPIADIIDGDLQSFIAGVNDQESIGFTLYPNPSKGIVHVSLSDPTDEPVTMKLFSIVGTQISKVIENGGITNEITFDLSSYPDGLYIYRLSVGTEVYTGKLQLIR
ncbi:MAG: T9SS type A sorting domain-containing protein, partial [Bacteroidales bacterium]|nr:T9SS type A sorting domain-containing protein [Bacteroidales bacterium]